MIFGGGEIIFEKVRYKKVSGITWAANILILGLGGISILADDGIWFKLQPAIFEAFFALFFWGSVILKKPLLLAMAEKQGQLIPDFLKSFITGLTVRMGVFFALHAALATWAAFEWTTAQWALLKGAGVTVSFLLYMGVEFLWMRSIALKHRGPPPGGPTSQ